MRPIAPLTLLAVLTSGSVAHAAKVAVLGDTPERELVVEVLEADGHEVVIADMLPGLSGIDVVWRLSPWGMSADEAQQLRYFVENGKGLMLVGEAGDPALADSFSDFVGVLTRSDVEFLPDGPLAATHQVNPDARGGLAQGPEKLTVWHPDGAGAIQGVWGANVLASDGAGVVSAAAWGDPDLPEYGGRIVAMMDRGWIDGGVEARAFIRNTTEFLSRVLQICGDGVRTGSEKCDDGNDSDADDCTTSCQVAFCGDGIVNNGEACDDGMGSDDGACLSVCEAARCGDGVVWVGVETCDDGNTVDGDGCSAKCMGEAPAGVTSDVDGGENIDDSPTRPAREPEPVDNLGPVIGCSASGAGGGVGGIALVFFALAFVVRRRRGAAVR